MSAQALNKVSLPAGNPIISDFLAEDDAEICQHCGNVFRIETLKIGDDYNDFGHRYCPYCGLLTNKC